MRCRIWPLWAFVLLLPLSCDIAPQFVPTSPGEVHIVLTFDDGPFAADAAPDPEHPDQMLAPLHQILDTLANRDIQAVFYTSVFAAGPPDETQLKSVKPIFADGIRAEHDAGHIIGYHCYDHSSDIWLRSALVPGATVLIMSDDLDSLESFARESLANKGMNIADVFTPIFRQPFGAAVVFSLDGEMCAASRDWKYHGYQIDSGDWTSNLLAAPDLVAKLPVATEQDHLNFVKGRFDDRSAALGHRETVDVLLHVNAFTASHLDEFIDDLEAAFINSGRDAVVFDVPQAYLRSSDSFIDTGVIAESLK